MTAFFSSLPPELVRQILSHLPRPSHGSPLPAPSPLLATALASPTLQVMSPELLFHSMTLAGEEYALHWKESAVRGHTRVSKVMAQWREDRDEGQAAEWLRAMFEREGRGRLEVLGLEGIAKENWA